MSEDSKRRGRRPSGEDTKSALLDAAREVFSQYGFDGATVRAIAAKAGVDAAMVNHWFGGKRDLFLAAVRIPIDNADAIFGTVLAGARNKIGERLVRAFVSTWDTTGGGPFVTLIRSASSQAAAARMLRDFFNLVLIDQVITKLGVDRPLLRASLCGSQLAGLGLMRYVIKVEPLASANVETLVVAVGPTLQRYLTGKLP